MREGTKLGGQDCTWGAAEARLFPCLPGQCLLQLPAGRCSAESLATLAGMNTQVRGVRLRRGSFSMAAWKRKAGWERLAQQPVRNGPGGVGGGPGWEKGLCGRLFPWVLLTPLWGWPVPEVRQPFAWKGTVGLVAQVHQRVRSHSLSRLLSLAVIGQKVNLAARMMVQYPGLVSCDAVTYAASRLPPYCFKELPAREMKGISCPDTIYQYVGIAKRR